MKSSWSYMTRGSILMRAHGDQPKTDQVRPAPMYSVCIINYNSGNTIDQALASILPQVSSEIFEVVVVDNESSDRSKGVLCQLESEGVIGRLVIERSNRGRARQLALESSSGSYLLTNIDLDVIYKHEFSKVLDTYHRKYEGKVLSVYGMMILPRSLANELGGWHDLDRHEDNDLAVRAFERGLHAQDLGVNVIGEHLGEKTRSFLRRLKESYISYRDWFRIGMKPSDLPGGSWTLLHPTILTAFLSFRFYQRFPHGRFSEWYEIWTSKARVGAGAGQ